MKPTTPMFARLSVDTLRRKLRFDEAERCLLEYRPAGETIDRNDKLALFAKLALGLSPADAAEEVQAERVRP